MQRLFTRPDAWSGGSYELALEYGRLDPDRLRAVLSRLWSHPSLSGCYLHHDVERDAQPPVSPADADPELCLRGVATLPNGERAACSTIVVADEAETWVYFGVPMGSLGYSYPVGAYPFDDGMPLDWQGPLDEWLLDIVTSVYMAEPFRLGLIGWLMIVEQSAAAVVASGVPAERWEGYVVPEGGALSWFPQNQRQAPITLLPPTGPHNPHNQVDVK